MRLDPHFRRRAARCCLPGALSALLLLGCSPAGPLPLAAETAGGTTRLSGAGGPAPNIVVVMADDMRFDDLRFAPGLRRLARAGVTFENSFSSFPLCCPARASFLTGQLPHNHGVLWHGKPQGYRVFDDSRTLATAVGEAGYRTGFVGKYLNRYGLDPSLVHGTPSHRYVPNGWTNWYATFEDPGVPGVLGDAYDYYSTPFNINGSWRNHVGRYQTEVVGSYTRDLVRKYHRQPDPFLLYVNYLAPHGGAPREADDPRGVRDRAGRRVRISTPARPGRVRGRFDHVVDRASGVPRGGGAVEPDVSDKPPFVRRRRDLSRTERAAALQITRQRAEAILAMDQDIARTVRTLKRSGEWADTVFVFTSDNGYLLGEHRLMQAKVRGYEPSLRVPLLVTGPGLRDGSRRYDPITTVDLTATLLDIAGASAPRPADGVSLLDVLDGGDTGWVRAVPVESAYGVQEVGSVFGAGDHRRSVGVRTSRFSYTVYSSGRQELYDLSRDPHQLESVAGRPAYRADRRALQGVLDQLEDCRGSGCLVVLPDRLGVDADTNRRTSRRWLTEHRRRYGWR